MATEKRDISGFKEIDVSGVFVIQGTTKVLNLNLSGASRVDFTKLKAINPDIA